MLATAGSATLETPETTDRPTTEMQVTTKIQDSSGSGSKREDYNSNSNDASNSGILEKLQNKGCLQKQGRQQHKEIGNSRVENSSTGKGTTKAAGMQEIASKLAKF
jgi:hypothetical protein